MWLKASKTSTLFPAVFCFSCTGTSSTVKARSHVQYYLRTNVYHPSKIYSTKRGRLLSKVTLPNLCDMITFHLLSLLVKMWGGVALKRRRLLGEEVLRRGMTQERHVNVFIQCMQHFVRRRILSIILGICNSVSKLVRILNQIVPH